MPPVGPACYNTRKLDYIQKRFSFKSAKDNENFLERDGIAMPEQASETRISKSFSISFLREMKTVGLTTASSAKLVFYVKSAILEST